MPYIDYQKLAELEADIKNDAASDAMRWRSLANSHVGRVRALNEDAYLNSSELRLWAVADGMGGHYRGDYASKVVVESLVHFVCQPSLPESVVSLEAKLREAHGICRTTFKGERVGATVATLFCYGGFVFFLWAGDSRIYRWRAGQLQLMTTDHTVAQERCARGELSPLQASLHASAHVLTRAVGVHQTLHLDLEYDQVVAGDRYLICSDGLYNDLEFRDIARLMALEPLEEALEKLMAQSLTCGGRDNITAIIAEALSSNIDT